MRLHELAKKHGFNQQDLLTAVQKQGFDVKNTLTAVEPDVEAWVAGQATSGWIPPPPEKKSAKKKKVVLVKTPANDKAEDKAEDAAAPEQPQEEPALPKAAEVAAEGATKPVKKKITVRETAVVAEKKSEEPAAPAESEASAQQKETNEMAPVEAPVAEKAATVEDAASKGQDVTAENASADASATEDAAEPEQGKEPVAIKRINPAIKGSAVVGQASPEMIAAIKRGNKPSAPAGKGRPDRGDRSTSDRPDRPDRSERPERSERPGRGKSAAAASSSPQLETVMPDTDLSGKPRIKQRIKTKGKGDFEDAEEIERKAKAAKRGKEKDSKRQGWVVDEDFGEEDDFTEEEEARPEGASNTTIIEAISTNLIAAEDDDKDRSGFKHKRADFKSKRTQHELPASFAEIDNEFTRSLAGGGGRRRGGRGAQRRNTGRRSRTRRITQAIPRVAGQAADVYLGMTLRDLSVALGVKLQEILAWAIGQGKMIQVNDILSEEDIVEIAGNYKIPLNWATEEDLERELAEEAEQQAEVDTEHLVERPPVVTFMGHVDHGKTSLLDSIRHTRVVDGEHGGITQHIGAYSVERDGKRITFLDTPGHEAFSAMRARGANLTDIAVLVVAADDGVMPQTEEAAAHAKNAGVPIVVAINKCDLPSANSDRVRQELSNRLGLLPEEWGGQVGMVEVSAINGHGITELLERILLEAEVLELRANPDRPATGFVVEARMSEGQGVLSTMLVSDGTLRSGDVILCSNGYGKIRFMLNEFGNPIEEAGPGTPVRLSGLSAVPEAGDKFFILQDITKARAIAEQRERESRAAALARRKHVTLENLTAHLAGSGKRELSVIIKADVVGSLEVIEKTLKDMQTEEVGISVIHSAVGGINHADVILADASDAIVLGFHVTADSATKMAATSLGVQIKTYHIIYRMIEDMRAALEGMLPPEEKEVVQGHVEIRQVFRASKIGAIAGCYVTDGFIQRTSKIRLYRNNVVVYDGTIQSLKRVKDDVREVKSGFECGLKIANYDGIEEGDVVEAYTIEEIARKL